MPHAIERVDMAGRDVSQKLEQLLRQGNRPPLPASLVADRMAREAVVRSVKEKHAYVAPAPRSLRAPEPAPQRQSAAADASAQVPYSLPDGTILHLHSSDLGLCMEGLFDPSVIGFSAPGLADVAFSAIMKTDLDLPRDDMYANIVLSGGSTDARGFAERLHTELAAMAPSRAPIRVIHASAGHGSSSNWAGGAMLTSLPTFGEMWITRKDYDNNGPSIVHKKCF